MDVLGPIPSRRTMEEVVLVNDNDEKIGVALKDEVHTTETPLHRAFSIFIFDAQGRVLLTKRSEKKKTFPGVWTNAVCGHPGPDEERIIAAQRRLREELGLVDIPLSEPIPYRYRFADKNGIVENEICPIFVGIADIDPKPNEKEVDSWKWTPWEDFLSDIAKNSSLYSPWCREEALLVSPKVRK